MSKAKRPPSKQVQPLLDRIAKLNQRVERLQKDEDERERKADTRRKILLGIYLLELVKDGEADARAMVDRVVARVPKGTAKVFEGWQP